MAVFRDESGRRARAVRTATLLGGVVAAAAVALFLFSVLPLSWLKGPPAEEPAPPHRAQSEGSKADQRAREVAFQREEARLRGLLAAAQQAQEHRPISSAPQPVLAAFVVNWDPGSLASLQAHADQLTHVMPEWIRVQADGSFTVDEDVRIRAAATHLDLVPTVTNYGAKGFTRELARVLFENDRARHDTARRLAALCEERGYAGINLDLENLDPRDWRDLALLVEAVWAELHPKGFLVTIDLPPSPKDVPVERLAASTDFLVLMAYDEHSSTDNPGPIATPQGVEEAAAAYLAKAPAEKLVVALGAYGYNWPLDADGDTAEAGAEELSFAQALVLARENEVAIEWDEQAGGNFFEYDDEEARQKHAVWFLDAPAALAQLQGLQRFKLRGSAIWRLGAEDPKLFSLFARPPAPRAFDPEVARKALDGVVANDPADVQVTGDGELLTLKGSPQPGKRVLTFAADGTLSRVDYTQVPSGWILERRGKRLKDAVTLTFDDGPDAVWTPRILDVLKERGVHAAFFVIGENAQAHPALVRRALAEGHLIGNHSTTHPDLSRTSPMRLELELNVTERLLEWVSGARPRLFRPPFHSDEALDEAPNAQVIARASQLGYLTLGQDIDPEDFSRADPREIAARTLAKARSGSVVLLHDGGGDRRATLEALPLILDGLKAQGIRVADPEEMVGMSRAELLPPASHAAGGTLVAVGDSLVFSTLAALAGLLGPAFGFAIALLGLRAVILAIAAPLQARRARRAPEPAAGELRPTVSVVVPGYNEDKVICRTVESLLAQEPPVLEVVCVDDGSTDKTLEVLRQAFAGHPRVRILTKPNGGKSSALNLGFQEARGELVVALDSDTVFAADTVALLCAPFSDPRVVAVAGNAKVGNRVNQLTRWQALEYVTAQNLERRAWDLCGAVPVVPGAVGAWRRAAVLEAGGFHEDTLAEDTDLTLRLIAAGHRVVYADRALAYTEAPETAKALLKQRFRWTHGILQACWKHRGRLFHRGGGVLGWLILPAFAVYQFLVPLVAPAVDLLLLVSLVRGRALETAVYYLLFFALDLLLSAVAVLLEGEDLGLLLGLFVQRIAYRQLLWVALARSLWSALHGFTVGWGKLQRTGSVQGGATRAAAPATEPVAGAEPAPPSAPGAAGERG